VPYFKESSSSCRRDYLDGSTFLFALQHRPKDTRVNDRWLIVRITPRIIIEEEERQRGKN
jgi:hypothetical protein